MTFIGCMPSTQLTSSGSCIGSVGEAALCQDTVNRLVPKLQAAGHKVQIFAGSQDANSDGAYALVAARPNVAFSFHLDSAGGRPGALLCYQEQGSLTMGLTVLNVYCQQMGIANKGSMLRTPGVNGVAVIRIPEAAGIPTALLEMGDMDCPDGTHWLDGNYREKAAQALCIAICAVVGGVVPPVIKKEDDGMLYGKEWMDNDKTFSYPNCWRDKYSYYFFTDGNWKNLIFRVIGEKGGDRKTAAQSNDKPGDAKFHVHNLQDIMNQFPDVKGSYRLIVTSDTPCKMSLREGPK